MPDLKEMLGFDPTVELSVSGNVLGEAIKEIQEERALKVKAKAKEQLLKAIDLQTKMKVAKRNFEKEAKKFDKELGKVMKALEAMSKGEEVPPEEENKEEKKEE